MTTRPKASGLCIALAGALLLLCATPALADDFDPAERGRVEMLLHPYDHSPDAKAFRAVAADPQAHLLEIASAAGTRQLTRLQALTALSYFPDKRTLALYTRLIDEAGLTREGTRALHRVIQGMAFGFGESALPHLTPLLKHADPQVRLTVAHALAHIGEPGKEVLRAHVSGEKDLLVQEAIGKLAAQIK